MLGGMTGWWWLVVTAWLVLLASFIFIYLL
jgi:hypothetical protein